MKLLLPVLLLLSGCSIQSDFERYLSNAKPPIIMVAKEEDRSYCVLRDANGNYQSIAYAPARALCTAYNIGDTLK